MEEVTYELNENIGSNEYSQLLTQKPKICGLYFLDGKRKIDFVLVYRESVAYDDTEIKKEHKRAIFEKNLIREGLELEKTGHEEDIRGYIYVKIHAPFDVLCKYAQLMNIKMPIKEDHFKVQTQQWWTRLKNIFELPERYKPKERHYFTCVFNKDYIDRFLIPDKDTFFDNAKRSKIVHEILSRCKYDVQINKFGLAKLISTGAYITAFPLHDGPYYLTDDTLSSGNSKPDPSIPPKNLINGVPAPTSSKSPTNAATTPDEKDAESDYYKAMNDYYSTSKSPEDKETPYYKGSPLNEDAKAKNQLKRNSTSNPNTRSSHRPPSALKPEGQQFWGNRNDRQILHEIWSNPRMFYKEQPISLVRKYYGEKVAMYFAWLGFYTAMLVPAAILGVLCFLYGLATMNRYVPTNEICDGKGVGNITMCPLCDELCDFWKLKDSCLYSKLTYLFDNPATIAFSVFMSFWATFFLEFWKRKQNELAWDWDTKDFEEEEIVRPEYETQVKTMRKNPVTNVMEPYLPLYSRVLRLMGATITVITFLVIVIGIVLGVILYRLSVVSVLHSQGDKILSQNAKMTTNITAALLNLLAILLLNRIYSQIATYLTDLECPRTRSDYEDSFTVKMFLFQFVNYYSSLIYIAFFKGRYSGNPSGGGKLLGYKMEPCEPAGCMAELFIQFIVIMIGKQILNNIQELLFPVISNAWRRRSALRARLRALKTTVLSKSRRGNYDTNPVKGANTNKSGPKTAVPPPSIDGSVPQYQEDFTLEDTGPLGLFDEYLEMGIQFGFTTMFVAAFPLAPLFSLLNNVIEIRLDAFKYVTQFRRSVSNRAQDIGVWYGIINVIAKLAVITNAMIIAFTSDFIPKIVYKYHFSRYERLPYDNSLSRKLYTNSTPEGPSFTLEGYINQSLSYFNLSFLEPPLRLTNGTFTGSFVGANTQYTPYCRYRDYRIQVPPFSLHYKYWVILVTRLAFVIIFEHFVFFVTEVLAYLIPDMPYALKVHLTRQRLLLRGALYEYDIVTDEANLDGDVVAPKEKNSNISPGKTSNKPTAKATLADAMEQPPLAGQHTNPTMGEDLVGPPSLKDLNSALDNSGHSNQEHAVEMELEEDNSPTLILPSNSFPSPKPNFKKSKSQEQTTTNSKHFHRLDNENGKDDFFNRKNASQPKFSSKTLDSVDTHVKTSRIL